MRRSIFILVLGLFLPSILSAQAQKLRDFKDTNQRIAVLGLQNEFISLSVEERIRKEVLDAVKRYSAVVSAREAQEFEAPENPNRRFFRPTRTGLDEGQEAFLSQLSEDNEFDILLLGVVREAAEGLELELQLYDTRIETPSGVEVSSFSTTQRKEQIERLVHRLMNYIDRDGFVHPSPQNFLQAYQKTGVTTSGVFLPPDEEEFSLSPGTLGGGSLVGPVSIGGEQTPFWEKWWFWTIIGGTLITGGSLTYYFLVVDQPPTKARVEFPLNQ